MKTFKKETSHSIETITLDADNLKGYYVKVITGGETFKESTIFKSKKSINQYPSALLKVGYKSL